MKIAITGHTAGIGYALANEYKSKGHDIVGFSRSNGYDIRRVNEVAELIESCDTFINNAHSGFAQTELLLEIARRWQGTNKHIIVIGTMLAQDPIIISSKPDKYLYRTQKVALEEAVKQIRFSYQTLKVTLVRPGSIATNKNKTVPPAADVVTWANILVRTLDLAQENNLAIEDISIGPA